MLANSRPAQSRMGFTLVEMLVVIAIIGILASLTIPAVMMVQARARQTKCLNNLREIGNATTGYETNNRKYPGLFATWQDPTNANNIQLQPWHVTLLPHLDQQLLFDQIKAVGLPQAGVDGYVPILNCPSEVYARRAGAETSYAANAGRPDPDFYGGPSLDIPGTGIFYDRSIRGKQINPSVYEMTRERIRDGAGTTLLYAENANINISRVEFAWDPPYLAPGNAFYTPGDPTTSHQEFAFGFVWFDGLPGPNYFGDDAGKQTTFANAPNLWYYARPSSWHAQSFNVVFADGHTASLDNLLNYQTYARLMTSDSTKLPAALSYGAGRVDQSLFAE